MKNINNKIATLKEQFAQVESGITLKEYVENERAADPGFMRWLLDDEQLSDFGGNITEEQEAEYTNFLSSIK